MSSKRQRPESSRRTTRRAPEAGPHGIIFRDSIQEHKFTMLSKRRIVPTRYVDDPTLNALGLYDDVYWLFNNIGWSQFVTMKADTYERITLEFLSSLNANVLHGDGCIEGEITFRLFNTEHTLTLAQFDAIYGFPHGGTRRPPFEFVPHHFWMDISHPYMQYHPSSSKSSSLSNPCFRYAHRVMSNTIFGRGDSDGVVRQTELMFLWNMLNPRHSIDSGSFLVSHMSKVSNSASGKITIGGLITPIALFLGHSFTDLPIIRGNSRIDLEACMAMHMIIRDNLSYRLVIPNCDDTLLLPDPARTTIQIPENWKIKGVPQEIHPAPLATEYPHQPSPYNNPSPQYHSPPSDFPPPPPTYASQEAFDNLREEVTYHGVQLTGIHDMVSAMYNWHLHRYPDDFPPPDPQ